MSLSVALFNAVSGLQLNQKALDIAAQNVANVNTVGYSRKTIEQQAKILNGSGAGVEISRIGRNVNEFIAKDMRTSLSLLGVSQVREDFFGRMQDLFGSLQSNGSLTSFISELATRFQALANAPEDISLRTEVANRAEMLAQHINAVAADIQSLRFEADRAISDATGVVAANLTQIQEFNLKIAEALAQNLPVVDLQDQRDLALTRISEQMGIKYFSRSSGEVVVMTEKGRMLLDRSIPTFTHESANLFNGSLVWDGAGSAVDGIDLNTVDITSEISTGRLAALIEMRDTTLPNLYSQIEEMTAALHDNLNRLHNQGTSFPGLTAITGSRVVAAADPPTWTGTVRIAIVNATATVQEFTDFNLAGFATIGAAITALDAMTELSASISPTGKIVLTPTAGNRIAINEMNSAVTVANETLQFSQFLGLNDLFTSLADYDVYTSSYQSSRTTALGLTGTLTFTGGFGTVNFNYAVGDSMTDIATAINLDAGLIAAGISASAISEGTGYRLRFSDDVSNGLDNFFIADTANGLISSFDVKARDGAMASSLTLRADIKANPSLVAHATLTGGALLVGQLAVAQGDNTIVQSLANEFNRVITFNATGLLAGSTRKLADYASEIIALNSTQSNNVKDVRAGRQFLYDNLRNKSDSISGVNLDEEMANMILLENAYAASARVIATTSKLFDILTEMVR